MQLGRIVDADGHILEPPNLWKENLESKYKERALQIVKDEEGWEALVIDGKISPTIFLPFYVSPSQFTSGKRGDIG